jgi:hypoxanthine-DNA glycosylase
LGGRRGGTLPGQESLRQREYYAHPRNAFWRIVGALFGIPAVTPYPERVSRLSRSGIALWDICAIASRPGSLDASIRPGSVVVNDVAAFLGGHPRINLICFNGAMAGELFRRHVTLTTPASRVACLLLPSTSPANARLSFAEKLECWSVLKTERET